MLFAQVKYIERCKAGLWFQRVILAQTVIYVPRVEHGA